MAEGGSQGQKQIHLDLALTGPVMVPDQNEVEDAVGAFGCSLDHDSSLQRG